MTYIPAPSFILFCQLASCAAYVKFSAMSGFIQAEGLEWGKSKKFALIVFGFIGTLFSNVTSLRVRPNICCMLATSRMVAPVGCSADVVCVLSGSAVRTSGHHHLLPRLLPAGHLRHRVLLPGPRAAVAALLGLPHWCRTSLAS